MIFFWVYYCPSGTWQSHQYHCSMQCCLGISLYIRTYKLEFQVLLLINILYNSIEYKWQNLKTQIRS